MKIIAVVCGGNSGEYDVSVKSGKVVFDSLPTEKYQAFMVIIKGAEWLVRISDENMIPI